MIYKVRLIQKKEIASGTKLFEFVKPRGFIYKAGQCVDMILAESRFSGNSTGRRTLSLASAPHEKTLCFAVRMRDSAFKKSLGKLVPGEAVFLEPALGSFGLHAAASRPVVLIAGGIGVTPFISILRDSLKKKENRRITLLYSNRTKRDSAFFEELEKATQLNTNFNFVPIMTSPEKSWRGETGRIDEKKLRKYSTPKGDKVFYIAGGLSFVVTMRECLLALGITDENIRTDEFVGY